MKVLVVIGLAALISVVAFADETGIQGMRMMPSRRPTRVDLRTRSQMAPLRDGTAPIVFPTITPSVNIAFRPRPERVQPDREVLRPGEELPSGEEPGLMELPEDFQNMNMTSMDSVILSNLETIESFRTVFGLPMPNVSENDGIFARFGGPGEGEEAVNAVCAPENVTVRLDLPRELNVMYFPRCVRLLRCGGCCHGPLLSCRPTEKTPVLLKIYKITQMRTTSRARPTSEHSGRSRGGSRGRPARRRREDYQPSFVELQEFHHEKCTCNCRIMPGDCNPALQDYDPVGCMCQCKNQDEKTKCEVLIGTHYWDNKSCSCYCNKDENCGTGLRFDHTTCRCVKLPDLFLRSGRTGAAPEDVIIEDSSAPITFT